MLTEIIRFRAMLLKTRDTEFRAPFRFETATREDIMSVLKKHPGS